REAVLQLAHFPLELPDVGAVLANFPLERPDVGAVVTDCPLELPYVGTVLMDFLHERPDVRAVVADCQFENLKPSVGLFPTLVDLSLQRVANALDRLDHDAELGLDVLQDDLPGRL